MANFLGGVIPTVKVSSSTTVNMVATGLIETAANSAVNVALGATLPPKVASTLGVTPTSLNNVLSSAIAPAVITAGQSAINSYLIGSIANSQALSPLGPLATNLTTIASQSLIGNLFGGLLGGSASSSNRWFPGAGDEPDAFYNGSLYTGGPAGSDVVFSIKSAESVAIKEAQSQWFNPSPEEMKVWESTPSSGNVPSPFKDGDSSKLLWSPTSDSAGTSQSFKSFSENYSSVKESNLDAASWFSSSSPSLSLLPPKESWNFICAPNEISWSSEVQAERVQIFGTNQAPVTAGSKGMRDLNLSNALVEGFTRGKSVETKIAKLESLMDFSLDVSRGYVKVPVFYVTANDKKYGFGLDGKDGGYFIIKSVNVKEDMRDLKGNATRGTVDVTFIQVPPYQVDSGRDIASKSMRGQTSILGAATDKQASVLKAAAASGLISQDGVGGKGSVRKGDGKSTSGASAPGSSSSSSSSSSTRGTRITGGEARLPSAPIPTTIP